MKKNVPRTGDGVIRTRSLDFKLTNETFEQWMRCVVNSITVGVMEQRNRNLLVEVVPLVAIILTRHTRRREGVY
jgi:truncated hemoglobin YjbI